jgi:hypothetical protein
MLAFAVLGYHSHATMTDTPQQLNNIALQLLDKPDSHDCYIG